MAWPVDAVKLERVRSLMAESDLDALVCRAPDDVLYLTDYWCMKGYDHVIFPREGEPTLVVIEPQEADARRIAWTEDIRLFRSYDPSDPRPPLVRAQQRTLEVLRERDLTGRVGIERTNGSQTADRMVGEPTVYTADWFAAFDGLAREVVDAMPVLIDARAIKTDHEIERMRIANELAALA